MKLKLEEVRQRIATALIAHNTNENNALSVANALTLAEADGLRSHGLSRVAAYAKQARSGKVDGNATPLVSYVSSAALRIDAQSGFAYPALEIATQELLTLTKNTGIGIAAIANSHHCGVLGHQVEKLAQQGLIGLMFSNSPEAIAPWGGKRAIFGTNPIAFAVPRLKQEPLIIDLSLSQVARGKIKVASQNGESIPEGWALDAAGNPTTDATAALSGTMLPIGESKGALLVLMVEILSAAVTASHFGFEASSFFESEGPAPKIGQLMIAINPNPLSKDQFFSRIETLIKAILEQSGTRLPGSRKSTLRLQAENEGIEINQLTYDELITLGLSE